MTNFFGGLLGKAESNLKDRKKQLEDQEKEAMGDSKERQQKNEDAALGKTRLTTSDKKY